jgi:ABC-type dipeptide/oligopeptide/nickel transport system ATPase component
MKESLLSQPLLELENVTIVAHKQRLFRQKIQNEKAHAEIDTPLVKGVSFSLATKETVALVGNSGSGKSLTAQAILGTFQMSNIFMESGRILLEGQPLELLSSRHRRLLLGKKIGFIPQNPMNALNPLIFVGKQLMEATTPNVSIEFIDSLLDLVGLPLLRSLEKMLPCELSGGMLQRVLIAMALANKPKLVIADEPTTALDVTVQAQILDLLEKLQSQFQIGLLFITHDFGVVARIADRVVVLSQGNVVERGSVDQIFTAPQHETTLHLLESARYCYSSV